MRAPLTVPSTRFNPLDGSFELAVCGNRSTVHEPIRASVVLKPIVLTVLRCKRTTAEVKTSYGRVVRSFPFRVLLGLVLAACGGKSAPPFRPALPPGALPCGEVTCQAGQYCVTSTDDGGHDDPNQTTPYTTTACKDSPPDSDKSRRCENRRAKRPLRAVHAVTPARAGRLIYDRRATP